MANSPTSHFYFKSKISPAGAGTCRASNRAESFHLPLPPLLDAPFGTSPHYLLTTTTTAAAAAAATMLRAAFGTSSLVFIITVVTNTDCCCCH